MPAACPIEPWVELNDVLAVYAPELLNPTGDPNGTPVTEPPEAVLMVGMWEAAICEATWALFILAAGKVHPEQCWVEDYSTRGNCKLTLRRTPLAEVVRVEVVRDCGRDIEQLPMTDYCLVSSQTVDLCCKAASTDLDPFFPYDGNGHSSRGRCGCDDQIIRVHYRVGSTLPPGTEGRVGWLADQYVKAATGQKCQLPERVTAITRQGVSWTMLDPMEFLDKRFTGIGRIDSWLATVRMAHPAGEYIDPLRSNRLFSQQVDCGGGPFDHGAFGEPASTGEPFDIPDQFVEGS